MDETYKPTKRGQIRPCELKALKLRAQGHPVSYIAPACGVSKQALYKWLSKPAVKQLWNEMNALSVEEAQEAVRGKLQATFEELQRIALEGQSENTRVDAIKVILKTLGADQPKVEKSTDSKSVEDISTQLANLISDDEPDVQTEVAEEVPAAARFD